MNEISPATLSVQEERQYRERLAARLSLIWAAIIITAELLGAFDNLNEIFWDSYMKQPAAVEAQDREFALVAIDHIPSDRPWPWSRLNYAILLDSILPYSPQSVVFDVLLNDRDTQYTAFDNTFSDKVGMFPKTAFAAAVLVKQPAAPLPANATVLLLPRPSGHLPQFGDFLWPLDTFAGNASVGIRNLLPEDSGYVRRLPLIFRVGDQVLPSLTLQAVALKRNADLSHSEAVPGDAIYLRTTRGDLLTRIPIDSEGRFLIRFRVGQPPPWAMKFDDVPLAATQANSGDTASRGLLDDLRTRQLWVGRTDTETVRTVLGSLSPVEIQLDAVRAILHEDFIRPCPGILVGITYILLGVFGSTLASRRGLWAAGILGLVIVLAMAAAGRFLFQWENIALPVGSFAVLIAGIVFMTFTARHWTLGGPVQLDLDL